MYIVVVVTCRNMRHARIQVVTKKGKILYKQNYIVGDLTMAVLKHNLNYNHYLPLLDKQPNIPQQS